MSRTSMIVDSETPKVTETESYKSNFTFAIGRIRFSETIKRKLPADPYERLTTDIEFGRINTEFTDKQQIEINIKAEWKSRWLLFQPKRTKWIREMLKDLEFTINEEPPNIGIVGKFKSSREHWQDGLKWLKVTVQLKVPQHINID